MRECWVFADLLNARETTLPENRLHKHPESLQVYPGHKYLTEIHLQPAYKDTL